MDDVLYLLTAESEKNEYGVITETFKKRIVYCRTQSVSRAEFFGGGRNGLNPSFQFNVFVADYCGEAVCEYHGQTYAIYRTYHVPGTDEIELYAERQGGTNGTTQDNQAD